MSNPLERAIDCDDGDRAAKIIQDALGIELDDVGQLRSFPRLGQPIASSALASSASGCRPKRVSWPSRSTHSAAGY